MTSRAAREFARRRTLVLGCLLSLVWCQLMAFAQASSMAVGQFASDERAAQMALMPGCDDSDNGDQQRGPHCPPSEAMPDWSKLTVLLAPPIPNVFALVPALERGFSGPVHYGLPRGRAPPRAQFCCWLI